MRRWGFTLFELLIVVAILGILMTIGSYIVSSASQRSRDSQRQTDLKLISGALEQYYLENRTYPNFEKQNVAPIYTAKWQLSEVNNRDCQHTVSGKKYLTPFYISDLPEDPRHKLSKICGSTNYDGQYLYLSYSSLDAGRPTEDSTSTLAKTPAIGYWLLAKLERQIKPVGDFTIDDKFYKLNEQGIKVAYPATSATTHNYWLRNSRNN